MADMSDDEPIGFAPLDREAYGWVMRFNTGDASQADLTALRRWSARSPAHQEAFDRVSRTWKTLGRVGQAMPAEACVPGSLGLQPGAAVPRRSGIGRRALLGGALAASAAGAAVMVARPPLGLWPSWSELAADYHTGTGEQRRITLPGSVSIELNTRTSIAVRSSGADAGRIELIAGEAMVSTPKVARSFSVLAAGGAIVATDARFNVRWEGQSVCVSCLEGAVRVERLAASLSLPAGQQAVYSDVGIGRAVAIDPAIVAAWQEGLVIFRSAPITEVVAEINRYRPGRVILTNTALGRRQFNARFRIADIDQVVGQIEQVFGAHATMLPGGIVLLG